MHSLGVGIGSGEERTPFSADSGKIFVAFLGSFSAAGGYSWNPD